MLWNAQPHLVLFIIHSAMWSRWVWLQSFITELDKFIPPAMLPWMSVPWLLMELLLGMGAIGMFGVFVFLWATTSRDPDLRRTQSEQTFLDPKDGKRKPFPKISDPPSLYLSLVVPAYKEQNRLPKMMTETMLYLEGRKRENSSFSYEVVIVNDGSPDNTTKEAMKFVSQYGADKVRLLEFERNRGKGGAVRMGCLSCRGERILFLDADGATEIADTIRLEKKMSEIAGDYSVPAIAVGSRAHLQDEAVANRSLFRNLLMYMFHFVVYVLCVRGIKDTQCGFKMLTRAAVPMVFLNMHIERWAFDVELLYIARYFNIPIAEVAVNWEEIEGSKLTPLWSGLQMGRDLLFLRLRYMFGLWKIKTKFS